MHTDPHPPKQPLLVSLLASGSTQNPTQHIFCKNTVASATRLPLESHNTKNRMNLHPDLREVFQWRWIVLPWARPLHPFPELEPLTGWSHQSFVRSPFRAKHHVVVQHIYGKVDEMSPAPPPSPWGHV